MLHAMMVSLLNRFFQADFDKKRAVISMLAGFHRTGLVRPCFCL